MWIVGYDADVEHSMLFAFSTLFTNTQTTCSTSTASAKLHFLNFQYLQMLVVCFGTRKPSSTTPQFLYSFFQALRFQRYYWSPGGHHGKEVCGAWWATFAVLCMWMTLCMKQCLHQYNIWWTTVCFLFMFFFVWLCFRFVSFCVSIRFDLAWCCLFLFCIVKRLFRFFC